MKGERDMRMFSVVLAFVMVASAGAAHATPDSVYAVIRGDTVIIWNTDAEHYCALQFRFDVNISNRTISIVETDTLRDHVRCICTYDLSVSLMGLQSGSYDVHIYRRYYVQYPRDTMFFVGGTTFVVGPPVGPLAQQFFQSPCKQNPDVDVFPLSVGNQWTYRYYTQVQQNFYQLVVTTDSGRATYSVIDAVQTSDSTRWFLREHRDLTHRYEIGEWDTTYSIRDSSIFELIENLTGHHQLYVQGEYTLQHVFFFKNNFTDTTAILRYRQVRADGTTTFQSKQPGTLPPPYFHSLFTFERGVGLREVDFLGGAVDWTVGAQHSLLSSSISSVAGGPPEIEPTAFRLLQNYPNPFNPSTRIVYRTLIRESVELKVFDVLGREVATLVKGEQELGEHSVEWRPEGIPSGVYIYRLTTAGATIAKKMLLLR
jgi:hypothetical protein